MLRIGRCAMPVETKPLPSQEYLRECFDYDLETGVLRWRERPLHHFKTAALCQSWNGRFSGRVIRAVNSAGYLNLRLRGQSLKVHRLVFCLMGVDPVGWMVDHINGDRLDNRWCNLRLVDAVENARNQTWHRAAGALPVGIFAAGGSFGFRAAVAGRAVRRGGFVTVDDAFAAREKWLSQPIFCFSGLRSSRDLPRGVSRMRQKFLARRMVGRVEFRVGLFDSIEAAEFALSRFDAAEMLGASAARVFRVLPVGVYSRPWGRFSARRGRVHLGTYDTAEAASAAYQAAVAAADKGARA